MLPICQTEDIVIVKDGVRYYIRPICGENEPKYYTIMSRFTAVAGDPLGTVGVINDLIDLLVVRWEPETAGGSECGVAPEGVKLSSVIHTVYKNTLFEVIFEANQLTAVTRKN